MVQREIIEIDDNKCNGCGACIPNCPEGALQIIDGKARLISDLFCDGLGACIGHCPQGAISKVRREAEKYDERKVMANIVQQGTNTIKAHLEHLRDHKEMGYLTEAVNYLSEKGIANPLQSKSNIYASHSGCPGSRMVNFIENDKIRVEQPTEHMDINSSLRQWPIQLHLVPPNAPYFESRDVLLAADCVAYALGNFHSKYLDGKSLAIACPKLDSNQEIYTEKIQAMIDKSKINTLTVMIMEVPCCGGLLRIAKSAVERAERKIPIKKIIISIQGKVLDESWV